MAREIWIGDGSSGEAQQDWLKKLAEIEASEVGRVNAEGNRAITFKSWALQFQEFISNNAQFKANETYRATKWEEIVSDWQYIMDGLSEADIGNLAVEINTIRHTLSNHVKLIALNSIDNTLEVWLEKDVDTPTFALNLPNNPDLSQFYKGASLTGRNLRLTRNNNTQTLITLPEVKYESLPDKPDLTNHVYVVEKKEISNNEWYIVYSDGTAEYSCYRYVNIDVASAYGNLYQGEYFFSYPIKFKSRPAVTVTDAQCATGASWGISQLNSTPTTTAKIKVLDIASRTSASSTKLGIYVKGLVDLNDYKV